ncbi:hypothetical protein WHR41_03747 [Cladosporium halotolerans]|uniref:DH domain-containing protein n=1 Tax=Cladosporium halotolerans TaxID=1052096 RepID=A0AB34KRF2_9PEZI
MAVVVAAPPALSGDLALYHTTDPLLANSPLLIFHGTAASVNATSSRIQVHIFTPAGLGSYARLAVTPNSPLYSAVSNLPREEQGDEVCRSIAFGLKKYFTELPDGVKKAWQAQSRTPLAALFGDDHIAILASRMTKIENVEEVIEDLARVFGEQKLPWLDVDVVLPSGTIQEPPSRTESDGPEMFDDAEALKHRYGQYAELIAALGEPSFLPTSRLRRAPSKANSIGRSSSFLKKQKEVTRKEISELFETEGNYVSRIRELQSLADTMGNDLKSSGKAQLKEIFPEDISTMAELNSGFFDALQEVLNSTEEAALQDIDAMADDQPTPEQARQEVNEDTQGIVAIAKCFCEWFPKFADSYTSYMKSHAAAATLCRNTLRGGESALSAALHEVGEQKLTSLLIEPVQRLPRYTLYIDNIAKQLPAKHPALRQLMKARDIISDICTQEDAGLEALNLAEKLRAHVSEWPSDSEVKGRLVTAFDALEIAPPYRLDTCVGQPIIILVFTDSIVFLEKFADSTTTARFLMAELDSSHLPRSGQQGKPQDLRFLRRVQSNLYEITQALDNQAVQVVTYSPLPQSSGSHGGPVADSHVMYMPEGPYEGKVSRLIEDITKAKVEGRFSEQERESPKWDVRSSQPVQDQINLFSAVFEDSVWEHVAAREGCASTRIVFDLDRHSQRPRAGQQGIRTVIALAPQRDGTCRVSVDSIDGPGSREHVPMSDTISYVCRKLGFLLELHFSVNHAAMRSSLLERNADILRSIELEVREEQTQEVHPVPSREGSHRHRPRSPVKMLSSFLSASTGPGTLPPSYLKKDLSHLPSPRMLPPQQIPAPKPPSRESRPSSKDQPTPKSQMSMRSTESLIGPLKKLEETLSAYILALQARKGNIVGRNLKMRAMADELLVNDLYNSLLEDPNMMVAAAQAPVDVLFAAFEKFLNAAWKEQIGPVMPYDTMQAIQSRAETSFPTDFDEYFAATINSFAPQNQRAFKGIMRLLADLLDGTGNDGDRGTLTLAFAELLVVDGNPHDFVALFDRFVEDTDTYFGEPLSEAQVQSEAAGLGHKRSRSMNTGSLNSNTSSLRRKFGFGSLSRENSKSEHDSKVSSVWRTLSKSTRGESPAGSISRGTLLRSHSTDLDGRLTVRPMSQDEAVARKGASNLDEIATSPGSTSNSQLGLSTIGEHPSFIPTGPPKKKRRSSLSDLHAADFPLSSQPISPPSARRVPPTNGANLDKSLPNSPMPTTPPSSRPGSSRYGSPTREPLRSRLPSSFRKENSPGPAKAYSTTESRPKTSGCDEVTISSRQLPTSNIPTLAPKTGSPQHRPTLSRSGLSERPGVGNIVKKPSPQPEKKPRSNTVTGTSNFTCPPSPATRKLRMQSPQKLRERLQNEHSSLTSTQNSLHDELSRIGDELLTMPVRRGSVQAPKPLSVRGAPPNFAQSTSAGSAPQSNLDLAQRVLKLEAQLPSQFEAATTRISAIHADLASSLAVSETKARKLDELYRESNSENEALYARFNDELGRILKAVRGGEGVAELKKQVREGQEEVARLKRENGRLKRENVGLRAQMKE